MMEVYLGCRWKDAWGYKGGNRASERVRCSGAFWEGLTEEVTFYLPFKFGAGRTPCKGISVKKKKHVQNHGVRKNLECLGNGKK